ncbi:hypothetical protein MNBD_GAMMA06-1241 [hydrothermal vent metagenome]|uniref:Carrier domain-containing protein n=1 Tax=hydrothermal vent metagenome TaxID=652676 RepID=A0A3B0WP96_9ZZZZ
MPFDETAINQKVTEIEKMTGDENDFFVKVANIIVEKAGCDFDEVTLTSKLESLGVDSLKALTVLFELEELFDIEIPNEIIPTIVTVQDIVDKIENLKVEDLGNKAT